MELDHILKKLEERAIGYSSDDNPISGDFFVKFKRAWEPLRPIDFENAKKDFFSTSSSNDDTESKLSSEMAYLKTFDLSNWVMDLNSSKYVVEGTQKVSDTWQMILQAAEVAELKDDGNDEKREEYLEELKAVDRKSIRDAEDHLEEALIEFDEKLTETVFNGGERGPEIWGERGKIYRKRVRRAKDDLAIASHNYNEITAKLSALGKDPAIYTIERAKERLEEYTDQLGDEEAVPLIYMSPSNWYDPDADDWKKISNINMNESISGVSKRNNVGLGLGINLGFWKLGPKFEVETEREKSDKITDNFTVECEYLIPRVRRPWMDTSLLKAQNWYVKNHLKHCISDGSSIQSNEKQSEMFLPAVITGLILVKNIKIQWEKNTEETDNLKRELKLGGSFGYGLMQLVGKFKREKEKINKDVEIDDRSISIKGIRLIGYVCKVLAASPQLDSKVTESHE